MCVTLSDLVTLSSSASSVLLDTGFRHDRKKLFLSSSLSDGEVFRKGAPSWDEVVHAIEGGFNAGGEVSLSTVHYLAADDNPPGTIVITDLLSGERYNPVDTITMMATPGKYRLVVMPHKLLGERFNWRTWWGSGSFRGKEPFYNDDIWDLRTVCSDILVAQELFSEFFREKGISKRILELTRSDWDEAPP